MMCCDDRFDGNGHLQSGCMNGILWVCWDNGFEQCTTEMCNFINGRSKRWNTT